MHSVACIAGGDRRPVCRARATDSPSPARPVAEHRAGRYIWYRERPTPTPRFDRRATWRAAYGARREVQHITTRRPATPLLSRQSRDRTRLAFWVRARGGGGALRSPREDGLRGGHGAVTASCHHGTSVPLIARGEFIARSGPARSSGVVIAPRPGRGGGRGLVPSPVTSPTVSDTRSSR